MQCNTSINTQLHPRNQHQQHHKHEKHETQTTIVHTTQAENIKEDKMKSFHRGRVILLSFIKHNHHSTHTCPQTTTTHTMELK